MAYGESGRDAVFFLRRLQEEYLDKEKKLYMCFVDLEKAFEKVPRRVLEWAIRSSLTKIVPILKLFFSYFTSYFIPI